MVSMPSTASTNKPVLRFENCAPSLAWAMIFLRMDKPMNTAITAKTKGTKATQGLATAAMTTMNSSASGASMIVNRVVAV